MPLCAACGQESPEGCARLHVDAADVFLQLDQRDVAAEHARTALELYEQKENVAGAAIARAVLDGLRSSARHNP